MRRAARRDRNEGAQVALLRALGFYWLPLSQAARPDGYASSGTVRGFCEVKALGEPYTPEQMKTFAEMARAGIPVYVLETEADVRAFAAGRGRVWRAEDVRKVWSKAGGRKSTTRTHRPGMDKARTVAEMCCAAGCTTSRVPGSHGCAKHPGADAEVLPPPRKR